MFQIISCFASLFVTILIFFKWRYKYWHNKNLPYLTPKIPFGNSVNPLKRRENAGFRMKRHYDNMKANGWKHGGLFLITKPNYLLVDLDSIKNILTKDFQYFTDRGTFYNEKNDPLSAHLFAIGGQKWRNLRTKLTPTFTSGKIKLMFPTLLDCVPNLLEKIELEKHKPIDIKEILGCFTTDIIGSCAFGLDCNSFKEEDSPFRKYGRKAFSMSFSQILKFIFAMVFPNLALFFSIRITPRDVSNFFLKVVKDTVSYREENNFKRNDFMQLLIDLKTKSDGDTLSIEEIAAQSFVFFLAGFETSSTTMTFTLYELSRNEKIQEKVRFEILEVLKKYQMKITYEAVNDMKYLDQVINETLRMYPPVPFITRKCVKNYQLPDIDGIIEKDTAVIIPILGIHYDSDFYPNPHLFNPERFTEENKNTRHRYTHIPFGEGPRICIGMRFGLIQTKVGLISLLKNYKFKVNSKTEEPLQMKVNSFVLAAENEIWLTAEKL